MTLFLSVADKLKMRVLSYYGVLISVKPSLLSLVFTDSGRLFHKIADLCWNDFLPNSVLGGVRLIFSIVSESSDAILFCYKLIYDLWCSFKWVNVVNLLLYM